MEEIYEEPTISPVGNMEFDIFGDEEQSPILKPKCSIQEQASETRSTPDIEKPVSGKDSKKSIHHNFQKHTVTTLKKVVTAQPLFRIQTDSAELAIQMWNKFVDAK